MYIARHQTAFFSTCERRDVEEISRQEMGISDWFGDEECALEKAFGSWIPL